MVDKGFYGVLWEFQGDDMGFGGYTRPGKLRVCELEHDHRKFVDLPS